MFSGGRERVYQQEIDQSEIYSGPGEITQMKLNPRIIFTKISILGV